MWRKILLFSLRTRYNHLFCFCESIVTVGFLFWARFERSFDVEECAQPPRGTILSMFTDHNASKRIKSRVRVFNESMSYLHCIDSISSLIPPTIKQITFFVSELAKPKKKQIIRPIIYDVYRSVKFVEV